MFKSPSIFNDVKLLLGFSLLIWNSYSQCMNSNKSSYYEVSKYEKFQLRRFDKAVIKSISKSFGFNDVKGFYVLDTNYQKGNPVGIAYAEKMDASDVMLAQIFGNTKVGYVVFGKNYAEEFLTPVREDGKQQIAYLMNFLVAHEVAHLVQFRGNFIKYDNGWQIKNPNDYSVKLKELNADFGAGFFVGNHYLKNITDRINERNERRKEIINRRDAIIKSVSKYVHTIGDTDINSVQHHGTPTQRLKQFNKGLNLGLKLYPNVQPIHQYMKIDWLCLVEKGDDCINLE